ncbi:MAG TPA: pyridoxamine 5'-phosphate oxidase [Solirubrobacteraceae bacterium]|jgi:pyridoxamine 5'-phosphate oxidase|nr:pyridoxamine 5'-phosphate oxidase [Solirubrobacteraceae bacterium]
MAHGRPGVTGDGPAWLERDADPDPLAQFDAWFEQARGAELPLPEAAALATATPDGAPSVRMVLVKSRDGGDFEFFSNRLSRKGRELAANPRAALLFHWSPLGRQIRIEGPVREASAERTAAYVATRPWASRLSALASPQSETVESRAALERAVAELAERHGEELPLPEHWGGYLLRAEVFEFWQQRADRLHDRLRYRCERGAWAIDRLAP